MRKPAHVLTADEYIRRIDRMLLVMSGVVVGIAASFLVRIL